MKWFIITHIAMYSMDALALLIILCGSAFTRKPIKLRAVALCRLRTYRCL